MSTDLLLQLREVAEVQAGIVTARQAAAAGIGAELIRSRVRQGRWQRIHRGVYATFSGQVGRDAAFWAAVLSAGPDAMLSHRSAAELQKLTDEPCELVHLTVPAERLLLKPEGIVIHRSGRATLTVHPTLMPPRTRVEETILDLVDCAATVDDVIGWVTRGLGRGLTVTSKLRVAMADRSRIRWRSELTEFLSDDMSGVLSVLEYRYVRDVERPHGLPPGERQFRFRQDGRSGYRDTFYREYSLIVELDGHLAHPAERRWRDVRRDNIAAAAGTTTLRFGWRDVDGSPCESAAQVGRIVRQRGYTGLRGCAPGCPAGQFAASALGA